MESTPAEKLDAILRDTNDIRARLAHLLDDPLIDGLDARARRRLEEAINELDSAGWAVDFALSCRPRRRSCNPDGHLV